MTLFLWMPRGYLNFFPSDAAAVRGRHPLSDQCILQDRISLNLAILQQGEIAQSMRGWEVSLHP